ncbi:MAG: coenzyme F420-0:L-glutamate ligase [Anaerolineae bacterium]|nr:coenzyme F420-0:L-glutamate ligase [Anaerolineales bacterium]MCQ3975736.1 coenzyme F420-0:L-glutamate ligase [Anaerolineae bacterium]
MPDTVQLIPLPGLPLIRPGDDLAELIAAASQKAGLILNNTDIVVVAQKIVSKAEGRFVRLSEVTPSAEALALAAITGKPAEQVEVILWDTAEIVRAQKELLIAQHKLGFVSANAGVDHSNVSDEPGVLLRLPADPDASARAIRRRLAELTGAAPPTLIIDSHGRAWRFGTVGVAIGVSGLAPVQDLRGVADLFGEPLRHTDVGFTDQIAAAASLLMGQAAEGCPVVIVRGLPFTLNEQAKAADALRPKHLDVFR